MLNAKFKSRLKPNMNKMTLQRKKEIYKQYSIFKDKYMLKRMGGHDPDPTSSLTLGQQSTILGNSPSPMKRMPDQRSPDHPTFSSRSKGNSLKLTDEGRKAYLLKHQRKVERKRDKQYKRML